MYTNNSYYKYFYNNEVFMKKFDMPKDENGNLYWIPIVIKNKDYLVGFIESFRLMATVYDVPLSELGKTLSSDRFNDVMLDGTRIKDLTKKQLKEKVKDMILQPDRSEHIENDTDIYEKSVLTIDCTYCGMFYSFDTYEEIPEESCDCQICGKKILLYTGVNDNEIEYEGTDADIEGIVQEIHEELFNDGEE